MRFHFPRSRAALVALLIGVLGIAAVGPAVAKGARVIVVRSDRVKVCVDKHTRVVRIPLRHHHVNGRYHVHKCRHNERTYLWIVKTRGSGIPGPMGPQGPAGPAGPQGPTGATGATGARGPIGPQGEQGLQGLQGIPGPTGSQGEQGIQGETGEQGIQGIQGLTGPKGDKGDAGTSVTILGSYDTYEDLVAAHSTGSEGDGYLIDGDLWVWDGTDWVNVGHIQGPQGEQGIPGVTGAQGPQGPQGIQGVQGPIGLTGPAGPQGEKGDKGDKGDPGSLGLTYYGSFYDIVTQTNPDNNLANSMKYRLSDTYSGVWIRNIDEIVFDHAGTYDIQFSVQLSKTDGSSEDINIWLEMNGTAVPWTNTKVTIQGNTQKLVAAWNFFVTVEDGDYCRLMWSSEDESVVLLATAATSGPPAVPGIPSVIMTVNQVH